MTLSCDVTITVDAKDNTRAIFDSVSTDDEFYPDNPVKTSIKFDGRLVVLAESSHLPHLRATLNSTLRLIWASYDSIESVKI